jgi:hypothetical protein
MSLETMVADAPSILSQLNDIGTILMAKESDFGGYTGPIVGIATIATLIIVLSPPLKDAE